MITNAPESPVFVISGADSVISPVSSVITAPTTNSTDPYDGPVVIGLPTSSPTTGAVTTTVPNCYVAWTTTEVDPMTGDSTSVTGTFGGNCTQAQAVAAEYPGATVSTVTNTMVSSPVDTPNGS